MPPDAPDVRAAALDPGETGAVLAGRPLPSGRPEYGPGRVCAVVVPGEATEEVRAAVERQTRAPDEVLAAPGAAGTARAVRDAVTAAPADCPWLWLLDGRAVPEPEALERLLGPIEAPDGLPAPGLLAAKVVGPDGRVHPNAEPWPEIFEKDVSIAACTRGLVSLRGARWGSLLVHRRAIERGGLPRTDYGEHGEDLEWTVRLLRNDVGYLVPGSRALRSGGSSSDVAAGMRARANMLRGPAWRPSEKLWWAVLLADDAVRVARRRPVPVVRGVAGGLLAPGRRP